MIKCKALTGSAVKGLIGRQFKSADEINNSISQTSLDAGVHLLSRIKISAAAAAAAAATVITFDVTGLGLHLFAHNFCNQVNFSTYGKQTGCMLFTKHQSASRPI